MACASGMETRIAADLRGFFSIEKRSRWARPGADGLGDETSPAPGRPLPLEPLAGRALRLLPQAAGVFLFGSAILYLRRQCRRAVWSNSAVHTDGLRRCFFQSQNKKEHALRACRRIRNNFNSITYEGTEEWSRFAPGTEERARRVALGRRTSPSASLQGKRSRTPCSAVFFAIACVAAELIYSSC